MPTRNELKLLQALPLELKVRRTKQRIKEWVEAFGEDGVYVSFSGGKDSTVLLHIVRELYPSIEGVYVDTGLEYPEIKKFIKGFDNITILRPEKTFKQVIEEVGYPFFSKEVSNNIEGAKTYIEDTINKREREFVIPTTTEEYRELANMLNLDWGKVKGSPERLAIIMGMLSPQATHSPIKAIIPSKSNRSMYSMTRYKFALNGKYKFSDKCCKIMKKTPAHKYHKLTGKNPIVGTMASESHLRTQKWVQNGCNAFNTTIPTSTPMSFWTEQDVLQYIKENNIEICSVYGDIVYDTENDNITFDKLLGNDKPKLKTTGCSRTGCMFCGFGCHLEKGESRFELMKKTHPKQYDYIMKPWNEGGLGYKELIDWINENGNFNIKY